MLRMYIFCGHYQHLDPFLEVRKSSVFTMGIRDSNSFFDMLPFKKSLKGYAWQTLKICSKQPHEMRHSTFTSSKLPIFSDQKRFGSHGGLLGMSQKQKSSKSLEMIHLQIWVPEHTKNCSFEDGWCFLCKMGGNTSSKGPFSIAILVY